MRYFRRICIEGIVILFSLANLFAQWEPNVRLTFDNASSHIYYANAWQIASYGDTVHVVWSDDRDSYEHPEIYYKRSTDGGATWGPDTRLTYDPEIQCAPAIAVSASNVHVVWGDYRNGYSHIYYRRSTDGGTTWGIVTSITNGPTTEQQPSITVSGSNVHVVWKDWRNGYPEIYYTRSTDNGTTWGRDIRLTDTSVESWFPSVAVLDSYVHVVWFDARAVDYEIYYKHSSDNGITWETDKRLSDDDPEQSLFPSIAVSASNVHVVWSDCRDGYPEIYYTRSADGGTTWEANVRLTDAPLISWYPSIAVSASNVHVVWHDERNTNYEIYYKHSTDSGITWEKDCRLTDAPGDSKWSSVTISGSNVHVVWEDDRDGNDEIYYKRNPTGNVVEEEIFNSQFTFSNGQLSISPNPFSTFTTITLSRLSEHQITRGSETELSIYDVSGRLIKNFNLHPSSFILSQELVWDGRDSSSNRLQSGIYFIKLSSGDFTSTKKVILLR